MERTVNLTVPEGWDRLTQQQLRFLLGTMVDVQKANSSRKFRDADDYAAQCFASVATLCFFEWCGLKLLCTYADGWLVSHVGEEFKLTSPQVAAAIEHLGWARKLPTQPVRLDVVEGCRAVAADLSSGFSFDDWLTCEALWQAYQLTSDDSLLRRMARTLYSEEAVSPDPAETLGVFYWWASVKVMVSEMFPNFFKPSGANAPQPTADSLRRDMDAQIRALTKGDITKEKEILSMDAMRALTELDAQAREFEELNKKYPSKS